MRILGIILVALGALALGHQGVTYVTTEPVADGNRGPVMIEKEKTVWIPPVVGGIVVVCGLLLITPRGRRD